MVLQDDNKKGNGFDILLSALQPKVAAFRSPVLMVHGDTHMFRADKPFKTREKHKPIGNFTGVGVFGPREIHGVRIVVDTGIPCGSRLRH